MTGSSVIRTPANIPDLPSQTAQELEPVLKVFEFRVSSYYAGLIDWKNPDDPLRRIVMPEISELDSMLDIDASDEESNTPAHGLQHKYRPTALLLVNDVCSAYCRFCFRKRFTLATSRTDHIQRPGHASSNEKETTFDVRAGIEYISQHPEIDNVLITGGDPLTLSVGRLEMIIRQLRVIPHVRAIRIGSKVPAFDPETITAEVLDMLSSYSSFDRQIYLMMHFNHQRELTAVACRKISEIVGSGLAACNQTPLLRGVNDSPVELAALHRQLANAGVAPYYVFQCRPTRGNERFMLSLQEGLQTVNEAKAQLSGLAKRFRYVGSHTTGKIEIVGVLGDQLILRYHEAKCITDENRLMTWPVDRPVMWFDEIVRDQAVEQVAAKPFDAISAPAQASESVKVGVAHS
ncbi:MAG TPA: KamA family radical SAM protein [Candidatus Angelobacter sp.]|jgi:KamA family protein